MAVNKRIFYPLHAVGFASVGTPIASTGFRAAKGVQSIGLNTNFSLEQVFQLGQLSLYENIEDSPTVEVTLEKVLDGYALLQHLATPTASGATLAGRYNEATCSVAYATYNGSLSFATGVPLKICHISGAYVSAININLPVQGNATESITLVGNNKEWFTVTGVPWTTATQFNGNESPVTASGGVQRRENIWMGTGSFWPTELPGIDSTGYNIEYNGVLSAHIQSVAISTTLNRTELFELGRKGPYFRYAEFPTEVTCSIELTATEEGDNIDALENAVNLTDQVIRIRCDQGILIDLGTKNKLASVTKSGGDTGGGNVAVTYNYSNFNDLTITMPHRDPAGQTSTV